MLFPMSHSGTMNVHVQYLCNKWFYKKSKKIVA